MLVLTLKNNLLRYLTAILLLTIFIPPINADYDNVYYVAPYGDDNNDGFSISSPLKSIKRALELADKGDTIILTDGIYEEDIDTVRDGAYGKPITILGSRDAIVKGSNDNKIVEIRHDYIILKGFTIDGHYKKDSKDYYRSKLIWIEGAENVKILDMLIKNAGDECIRLKYFASNNEIAYNIIRNCGVIDFRYDGKGKNGEYVYIGTAPEQLYKNPSNDTDRSNNNWIHHNVFEGRGSECIDIKEGAMYNIIEYNICTDMVDENSGAINIRGNNNIVRYNQIYDNSGVGIRLGGDTINDGIYNNIYDNILYNNDRGAIKFMADPQSLVCNNIIDGKESSGKYKDRYQPTEPC